MKLEILQHLDREGPGLIAACAADRGWDTSVIRHDQGEPLPSTTHADPALLVVLGGPMGVGDLDDPDFTWLARESNLIATRLAARQPVLGICLGAQLLAHAAGGGVVPLSAGDPPSPLRELGWGAIHWMADAQAEPVLEGLAPSELVLHWHGDRIQLPPGATLLGSSLHCPEQFFRLGQHGWGLQFHVEVGGEALERWLVEDHDYVLAALGSGGADRVRDGQRRWGGAVARSGRRLIHNIFDRIEADLA
ncbi:type 1 glutamine amidotransferase [Cyanobium sp. Morenito 9A2]|uniref:type 1 glutamine amidotransferase n=1 Tax=Cyanobium sp. Morenito 9A2 TaxID=2823718 RepID=UPI0020CE9BA8|nr:type 1 glutamine amidotransferase [Cyanobium sp. Morenito 9A2]MCP9849363.1 type 1 glutamine amidotransferase [Cyanobium sp. Morenito 9A2]